MALLSARKEQYSHWVILGTMTCSLLEAHENLSCQTVKSEPAFTNVFQNWLTAVYCCKRETEGKKEQLRKLNHCQDIDWHLAGEEREQMKKILLLHCKLEGSKQMHFQYERGKYNGQTMGP